MNNDDKTRIKKEVWVGFAIAAIFGIIMAILAYGGAFRPLP